MVSPLLLRARVLGGVVKNLLEITALPEGTRITNHAETSCYEAHAWLGTYLFWLLIHNGWDRAVLKVKVTS